MAFVENLPAFFADFGVQVTAGGNSTTALFDGPDEPVLHGRAHSKEYAITYVANALGALAYESQVVVSGTPGAQFDGTYKVRVIHDIDDGRLQRAVLELP